VLPEKMISHTPRQTVTGGDFDGKAGRIDIQIDVPSGTFHAVSYKCRPVLGFR